MSEWWAKLRAVLRGRATVGARDAIRNTFGGPIDRRRAPATIGAAGVLCRSVPNLTLTL